MPDSQRHVSMFAGKGGVGKTTCAAITALHLASGGERTLIVSTDPTPSLSDIFEVEAQDGQRQIMDNLYMEEISLDGVKERWKQRFGPEVYEVVAAYVPVEPDFVEYMAEAPGIGDEFMLDYIRELVEDHRYQRVVWDTAPGGNTLRLLRLPAQFIEHMNAAVRVYSRLKRTRDGGRSLLATIGEWKELSQRCADFLAHDTEFTLVTIPEALSVRQMERIHRELDGHGFAIGQVIVNNVVRDSDSEFLKSRIAMQKGYVEEVAARYGQRMRISELPLLPSEVKGVESLRLLERELFP
ncbi:MAG: ArsA family ATPase [Chloroflexota bacterium]|nr:ArsA family ATPase [Chloroflexota bacterium]